MKNKSTEFDGSRGNQLDASPHHDARIQEHLQGPGRCHRGVLGNSTDHGVRITYTA